MSFFQNLNFTSANEDSRSELAALGEVTGPLVVLTGSGARVLDMLLTPASQVVALDMNPAQNALLGLKVAAFESLNYPEVLQFLGVEATTDRLALYARLAPRLTAQDRAFWDARQGILRKGVIYQGLWEKVLRFGAKGTGLIRGKRRIEELFNAPDLHTQSRLWESGFYDWIWRASIRMLGRPWVWTRVIGEPGGAFLPTPAEVEARLAQAFASGARNFLFRESDFASLILRGRIQGPSALPLHLLPENFEAIRAGLPRIRRCEGGLHQLAELGLRGIGGFSLSDFGSYCDAASYAALWRSVAEAAAPEARFIERIFMNDLPLPLQNVQVDKALSDLLTLADRAIIYRIRVGKF